MEASVRNHNQADALKPRVFTMDCLEWLRDTVDRDIHLTFIDPPFNQGKEYRYFDDAQPGEQYTIRSSPLLRKERNPASSTDCA
jgi:16S rRNA G966 N2-methylase RsmD